MRTEENEPDNDRPAMPDRGTVDAVEPRFDPGQRTDQDQRHREKQHGLCAKKLADMTAPRLASRSQGDPEDRVENDQRHHRERAEVAMRRSEQG